MFSEDMIIKGEIKDNITVELPSVINFSWEIDI